MNKEHLLHVEVASILWHEARLFTCYPARDLFKSGNVIIYELSSATQIVRWAWVRHNAPQNLDVPTVPLDEHNAQMQRLCEFVVARTGLPLYDLDKLPNE